MPNYDATKNNTTKRVNRQYKDLDLDFGLNSVTKDVNKLTDAEAVKRSVRNLINTNHYERFFRPELGSGLRGLLFEPVNEITTQFHQSSQEQNFRVGYYHFCYSRALTPLCFKVLPARVCSVNLRLLTHTTPLFCFFYFKLLFSKTLGLVVIYIDLYLYRRSFRPS